MSMTPGAQSIADLTTEIKPTHGHIPPPLVGASTTIVGDKMYVFGGRWVSSRQMSNELYILDLPTMTWSRYAASSDAPSPPKPRYFHTANVYQSYLVFFGGMSLVHPESAQQDLCALDDLCLFNLETMRWIRRDISLSLFSPKARYAHIAVCAHDKLVVMGGQDMANQYVNEMNVFDFNSFTWIQGAPLERQYGAYRAVAFCPSPQDSRLIDNPFWKDNNDDEDPSLCVYSNYNFSDVARDLQSFHPMRASTSKMRDHSSQMVGPCLPPGLRFPIGDVIGHHMVLTGTYLTPNHRSFHIWAFDLGNLVWTRIDTGSVLSAGSWNRGVLHRDQNRLYVLGHRDRDLLEDYNHRQLNFDHAAVIDLEAFGIYTPPRKAPLPVSGELGLSMLSELMMADMEVLCADSRPIPVNSTIVGRRWPYFAQYLQKPDKRSLHLKSISFPEPYPVAWAFFQYIYTDDLMTVQQHQPQVLARLLLLADMYNMYRLGQLATHALHQILTISTASMVYETAALTCRTALQVRALRVMINAKKMLQQQQQQQQQHAADPVTDSPTLSGPQSPHATTAMTTPFSTKRTPEKLGMVRSLSHDTRDMAAAISSGFSSFQTSSSGSSSPVPSSPPIPRRRLGLSKSTTTAESQHNATTKGSISGTSTPPPPSSFKPLFLERRRKGSLASQQQPLSPQQQPLSQPKLPYLPSTVEKPSLGIGSF
ncbi:uncharacterized protein BYT42DRAFT_569015 [Radiomyces spectabilis]|uniref:uncharacterized protein n=1 Tax=Radiomyces spectabilis TaxID=64574 RepID=UPI00221F9AFB|nr:uncharacterized protein BYT42DRAFT_569015 [Radiomyces spectabilis]KAI8379509.1 hypothetical protein BYT42DRAFT_569015 [Radiomyces spectabilis]